MGEIIFLFLLGASFGSFLNVLIFRYEPGAAVFGRHLSGRSFCPRCKKKLSWYELLPIVSFIIQRGKCRGCRQSISFQYPIVEIVSGLIVITVLQVLGVTPDGLIFTIALLILLAASVIDIRHYVIPDALTLIILALGVIRTAIITIGESSNIFLPSNTFLGTYGYVFSFIASPLITHSVAALVAGVFFAAIILLSKGKAMGWGDAKLAFATGLLMGWPDIILVLMIAFIIGAVVGISMIFARVKKMKDALPFGPFIAIGAATVIYFGHDIISLYFKLLNLMV